jgi:hypothetical protein
MLGLGLNEILIVAFFAFDTLIVGAVLVWAMSRRNKSSNGEAQRIAELEQQVANLQRNQQNTFGNTFNSPPGNFSSSPPPTPSASPFESSFSTSATNPLVGSDILDLIRQGQKIQAIKLYRERTNCGLKEAKDAVEALQRQM